MKAWESFPETITPRPIVLTSDLPLREGTGKTAGRVDLGVPLSTSEPVDTEVALPDGSAMLEQISASEAYEDMQKRMRASTSPQVKLFVTGAKLTTAEYMSDRGLITLPSWRFTVMGGGVLDWPAVSPDTFWHMRVPPASPRIMRAQALATSSAITIWIEEPRRACGLQEKMPEIQVLESADVVIVALSDKAERRSRSGHGSDCITTADLRLMPVTINLRSTLNNRVLLDDEGYIVRVARPE
ncbi:hypothetical protein [Nonomuraea africana]|uniref:Uncharacterized protein n=1 Tax=Nonomuraea africana TaxID=46171 RepID=A0ABR9KRT3_9ACTN|nr:hypothetical protein [Nonomuraea africana]MBE1564446.1 hypothetical protein [Nonomuraea africana]